MKEGDDVTLKCDIMVNPSNITWMVDDRVLNGRNCATRVGYPHGEKLLGTCYIIVLVYASCSHWSIN